MTRMISLAHCRKTRSRMRSELTTVLRIAVTLSSQLARIPEPPAQWGGRLYATILIRGRQSLCHTKRRGHGERAPRRIRRPKRM